MKAFSDPARRNAWGRRLSRSQKSSTKRRPTAGIRCVTQREAMRRRPTRSVSRWATKRSVAASRSSSSDGNARRARQLAEFTACVTRTLVNYALYPGRVGSFACSAPWNYPLTGLAIATVAVAIHVALATQRGRSNFVSSLSPPSSDSASSSVQLGAGTYRFASSTVIDRILRLAFALWAQLATTFRYSLHYVFARWCRHSSARLAHRSHFRR